MVFKPQHNYKNFTWLCWMYHFNSLFGHLVPYKHQRQVPNILEIIHVATLVRAHTHTHTHTHKYTHTYTHMTVSAIVAGIDINQYTCNKVSYYDVHTLHSIHSTSSRVNSDISQYFSGILRTQTTVVTTPRPNLGYLDIVMLKVMLNNIASNTCELVFSKSHNSTIVSVLCDVVVPPRACPPPLLWSCDWPNCILRG